MAGVVEHEHERPQEVHEQGKVNPCQPPPKPAVHEEGDPGRDDGHRENRHQDQERHVPLVVDEPQGNALARTEAGHRLVGRIADSNSHGEWAFTIVRSRARALQRVETPIPGGRRTRTGRPRAPAVRHVTAHAHARGRSARRSQTASVRPGDLPRGVPAEHDLPAERAERAEEAEEAEDGTPAARGARARRPTEVRIGAPYREPDRDAVDEVNADQAATGARAPRSLAVVRESCCARDPRPSRRRREKQGGKEEKRSRSDFQPFPLLTSSPPCDLALLLVIDDCALGHPGRRDVLPARTPAPAPRTRRAPPAGVARVARRGGRGGPGLARGGGARGWPGAGGLRDAPGAGGPRGWRGWRGWPGWPG